MNNIIIVFLYTTSCVSAAFGGSVGAGSVIEWTRSILYSPGFSSFNKDMEMSAVKARKSCTKILRQIYEIGALDDSRFRGSSYISMISSWISTEVQVPTEDILIYEQTKKILSICNLGTPTASVIDSNTIKPPEMHVLLDIIIHAHQNIRIASHHDKTKQLYNLDKTESYYLCVKLQALQNMIHIIHELGENIIISNLSIYELQEIFSEGLREYQYENEILTAENVGEVIKIREIARKLADYELDIEIQEQLLKAKQKRHQADMQSKIQERNQSADEWNELTQWARMYYDVGVEHISELTQFGHRLTKVTIYDTIQALFDSINGITYRMIYSLLFVLITIICYIKLIK